MDQPGSHEGAAEQDAIDQVCHPNITSSPNRGVA